jgi:hypothetical protein
MKTMKLYNNGNPKITVDEFDIHENFRGKDPRKLTVDELNSLGHHKQPLLEVIRRNCLDCVCGVTSEVAKCALTHCPFWPYRMKTNPFVKKTMSKEQRALASARMKAINSSNTQDSGQNLSCKSCLDETTLLDAST